MQPSSAAGSLLCTTTSWGRRTCPSWRPREEQTPRRAVSCFSNLSPDGDPGDHRRSPPQTPGEAGQELSPPFQPPLSWAGLCKRLSVPVLCFAVTLASIFFLSTMFTHSPGVFTEGSRSPESFFLPPSVGRQSPAALSASPRPSRSPQASCPPGLPLRPPQAPHRPRLFCFPRDFFSLFALAEPPALPLRCSTRGRRLSSPTRRSGARPSLRTLHVCTLRLHLSGPSASLRVPQSPFPAPSAAVGSLGHQNGPTVAKPLGGRGAGASRRAMARRWEPARHGSENSSNGARGRAGPDRGSTPCSSSSRRFCHRHPAPRPRGHRGLQGPQPPGAREGSVRQGRILHLSPISGL